MLTFVSSGILTTGIQVGNSRPVRFWMFVLVLCLFSCVSPPVRSESYTAEAVFSKISFERPVHILPVPGEQDSLAVITQSGQVYVVRGQGEVAVKALALDISDRVLRQGNEEGLLGIAFAPDFSSSGELYLYLSKGDPRRTVLSRFARKDSKDGVLQFDADSEQVLLEIAQPYSNHNGGHIEFGPDGYLYIGVGDGGAAGDPHNNSQNLDTLLGSLLRIDPGKPGKRGEAQRYAIPGDNPFQSIGQRKEIFAYGLRNPWRFSFDRNTGDLWLADVGQDRFEEINRIERGKNYGWPIKEASHCFSPKRNCSSAGLVDPVAEYGRGDGASVTGGSVYHGLRHAELQGKYIFADFVSGRVWALGTQAPAQQIAKFDTYISSIGHDAAGELYFTAFDGQIYTLR